MMVVGKVEGDPQYEAVQVHRYPVLHSTMSTSRKKEIVEVLPIYGIRP
jgi:hypothetical protein